MNKLGGKVALISGGTSGIGAATARLFQSQGAQVVVTGSSQASVDAAAAEMPGIEALVSDAGDVAATRVLVDRVIARHEGIDVLVANAGIAKFAPIGAVDEAFYDTQFDINVKGAFFLIKHAAPAIPAGGAIVLTGSTAGSVGGYGGSTIYAATKAALRSMTRTVAREMLAQGVRVNMVSPGPILTPILEKNGFTGAQKAAFIADAEKRVPMGRMGTPEEVAATVLYLAADATFTTGAEVFVGGGLVDL